MCSEVCILCTTMMMMLRFSQAQVTEEKGDEKDGNEEVGFRFEFKFKFDFEFEFKVSQRELS